MIDSPARSDALAKLAETREALIRLFEPRHHAAGEGPGDTEPLPGPAGGGFPRSRIMRLLMARRGLGVAAAVAGGLLLSRPGLLLRIARMIPVGAMARAIFLRYLTKPGAPT